MITIAFWVATVTALLLAWNLCRAAALADARQVGARGRTRPCGERIGNPVLYPSDSVHKEIRALANAGAQRS